MNRSGLHGDSRKLRTALALTLLAVTMFSFTVLGYLQ